MQSNVATTTSEFGAAIALLRSLISARKLLKESLDNPSVTSAISLIQDTVETGDDHERLESVSILGKIAEISKPLSNHVQPTLKIKLISPLPHTSSWGSAEDRYYLARGIFVSDQSWVPAYAAIELAQGDVSERSSREIWADIAVNRAQDLASVLGIAGRALADDQRILHYPVDTAIRKLNRVLIALANPLALADVPEGENFGRALSNLISQAGGRAGPESRSLREETAQIVLDFLVQVLRLRFSATIDSEVYKSAGVVLGWWHPASPPNSTRLLSERIVKIALSALRTLARQGVMQKDVRRSLVSAFGADLVNRNGSEIILSDPSLDPGLATWLATGRTFSDAKVSTAVRETFDQDFDELVAKLLLAVENPEGGFRVLELIADDLELLEPAHASTLRTSSLRNRLMAQWAQAIAKRRDLAVFGSPGELLSFDPAIHEAQAELQLSAEVRVKSPGVIKQSSGRPSTIILKMQVDKP